MPKNSNLRRYAIGALILVVACPILVILAAAGLMQSSYSKVAETLPQELELARKAGLATSPDELRARVKATPEQNAAEIYRKAVAAMQPIKKIAGKADEAVRDWDRGKDQAANRKLMEEAAVAGKPAIALVLEAAKRPKLDFSRKWEQGANLLFPEFGEARSLTRLLAASARVAALRGDGKTAFEQTKAMFKMAEHFGSDPSLIAALMAFAFEASAQQTLEQVLAAAPRDKVLLNGAADLLAHLPPMPDLRLILSGETVMSLETIKGLKSIDLTGFMDENSAEAMKARLLINNATYRKAWAAKTVHYQRLFVESLPKDPEDTEAIEKAMRAHTTVLEADQSTENYMNRMLSPTYDNFAQSYARTLAQRRVMQTAIAVLASRVKAGSFPSSLPTSLQVEDPFSGSPLKYRKTPEGFLVYSIGEDGVDDHGRRRDPNARGVTSDIVRSFK